MKERPEKGVLPMHIPVGEWRLGPGRAISFTSDPLPLAGRSCAVDFCGTTLLVRIDTVDTEGIAYGEVVGRGDDKQTVAEPPTGHPKVPLGL